MKRRAIRYHDFCAGHRVVGHEGKCKNLHGHNYRVTFHCEGELDAVGRVLDFSVIKHQLCEWLEREWDHRFLLWHSDPLRNALPPEGLVCVPFNPTAENMAEHLLLAVAPVQLAGTGVRVVKVVVQETARCSAEAEL